MARTNREEPDSSGEEVQLVRFRLGKESFGVNVEQVREIVKIGRITRVPETPLYVEGIMNLRGQVTTVIDLVRRFGIDGGSEQTPLSRIIVAEIGDNQLGMIVDAVQDVVRVREGSISPPPMVLSSRVDSRFLTGIVRMQDGLVMLLDLMNILTGEEMEGLGNLTRADGAAESANIEV